MKKKDIKPTMKVFKLKQSQIICASPGAPGYPGGPFNYVPGLPTDDMNKLA